MILKNYTADQLKVFLKPSQVQKEFGIDKGQLEYMRLCSRDEGKLRGPMFLKDDLIILYQRASVIKWLRETMFQVPQTDETAKSKKVSS
tara:strand:- start:2408 stop:2674 length:267 start_codon:yes stop_codon:yes gene_type:complete